ncbi:MAG: pyruvate kinase [Candidatus Saccharibacteria bacterium]|nr:pyruvate kinase [Candidatus Saccharibacteria bacterium]
MSKRKFKRTKILATIGPASFTKEGIESLIEAGINGCRLNFSHGLYTERDEQIKWIREAAKKRGRHVAILQDLQGPKIRLGLLQTENMELPVKRGDRLILDYGLKEHEGGLHLPVQYNLAKKVKIGEPIFMFDGKIETVATSIVSDEAIEVEVLNDGVLGSRKGLNLPETDFGDDIITEKDMADIEFGCSRDFDYVALSFVHSAADIEKLRQILTSHGSTAKIIAKIETKKAVASDEILEGIVEAADGVMVARGDMAVEAGAEVVPVVQHKLVEMCRKHAKLVIIATQMMGSMVNIPEPSRAEVSDVANAVIQGADVVMLSDETAQGKYPVETVKAMKKVILYIQNHIPVSRGYTTVINDIKKYDALAPAVVELAEKIDADLIVCQTATGATARAVAAQRPNLPIIAVTTNPRVANQLSLIYANNAYVRTYSATYGLDLAQELKASGYLEVPEGKTELTAIITSGHRNSVSLSDTIQIVKI